MDKDRSGITRRETWEIDFDDFIYKTDKPGAAPDKSITPNLGVLQFLQDAKKAGHLLVINTAREKEEIPKIRSYLRHHGIEDLFADVRADKFPAHKYFGNNYYSRASKFFRRSTELSATGYGSQDLANVVRNFGDETNIALENLEFDVHLEFLLTKIKTIAKNRKRPYFYIASSKVYYPIALYLYNILNSVLVKEREGYHLGSAFLLENRTDDVDGFRFDFNQRLKEIKRKNYEEILIVFSDTGLEPEITRLLQEATILSSTAYLIASKDLSKDVVMGDLVGIKSTVSGKGDTALNSMFFVAISNIVSTFCVRFLNIKTLAEKI